MAVNILGPGLPGTHSFKKVNVNYEENYIYFEDNGMPTSIGNNVGFIYDDGIGSVEGLPKGGLVFSDVLSPRILKFKDSEGEEVDITGYSVGGVSLNSPVVFDGTLNINTSTPTNQAVKYYTTETPIEGLVSGNTYFLKNVPAPFSGITSLYQMQNDTHTFTSCGQSGRLGPTAQQILAGYNTSWHAQYLSLGNFGGYQEWTTPVSGIYEFEVAGASGFDGVNPVLTINRTSLTSNVARIRTTVPHNLSVGTEVTLTNVSNSVYNGTYTVSNILNTTEFQYQRTNANLSFQNATGNVTFTTTPGRGVRLKGRVSLAKGELVTIAVGQIGEAPESGLSYGGSGGGTFVVRSQGSEPLFVAAGGSADANTASGQDGQTTTRGGVGAFNRAGGEDGFGGSAAGGRSAGGGGFFGRGGSSTTGEQGGGSFADGLTQNDNGVRTGGNGGFGGAGSSDGQVNGQSGGAGGYSGGSGARTTSGNFRGGGGGSFISRTATDVGTSDGQYEETSLFNGEPIENLDSYNTGNGSVKVSLIESFTFGNTVHPTAVDAENGTNAIEIVADGNSYHAMVPISYDIQNDRIHFTNPHNLDDGQAITFSTEVPTPDIVNGEIYYVNKIDDFTIGLISSPAINLTIPTGRSTSDTLRRVVVNTQTNSINIPNHGFSLDQPIQYSPGEGSPITPLQADATYYVSEVIDANNFRLKIAIDSPTSINFTSAGTGTEHSFLFLTVNVLENTLFIPSHGLISGQAVVYTTNGGDPVGGLVEGQTYYIIRVDASTIKLTTDKALKNVVNLTSVGTGTHSVIITSLDFVTDTITLPQHGLLQGELVEYDSRGQDVISGLSSNQTYYVIFIDGDNIRLASTANNAELGIPVDIQESPAAAGRHTLTSLSQTPDGIYSIKTIPTADTFTVEARGQVPTLVKQFNPRSTVNPETNALLFESHGFVTGTKLSYDQGDQGTPIGNLQNNTDYYAVVVNQDYFRLASSPENALAGITIDLLNFGSGVSHAFTTQQLNGNVVGSGNISIEAGSVLVDGVGTSFSKILKVGDPFIIYPENEVQAFVFSDSDVNIGNNRIEKTHGLEPGQIVRFSTGGGVSPTPLINNYYYYVGVIDESAIQIFTSKSAALNLSSPISFSSTGTGQNFSLTTTLPAGPIVRRITAVGSDTQVTVDRPYSSEFNQVEYTYPTFIYVRPSGYSLHRPFDGGVEMSTGAGNSFGQIIRQTRKYFRYQSGKGIQTSFAINFKPSIDLESMTRFSATTIECKTRRPHGLISGLFVQIAEAEDSTGNKDNIYNGDFQVTVSDLTTFRITASSPVPEGIESKAYGFPQFHVTSWTNGAIRSGMFDFQNGMFFEFDGQDLYCVRRSSTQQTAGTVSALRGSELIFGEGTQFTAQFESGDFIVLRGQTYKIIDIQDDTTLSVRPEYRGSTGLEITFDPETQINLDLNRITVARHGLSQNIPIVYNSIDGQALGGLINGRTYYADVIDANNFRLFATPSSETNVNISTIGTTNLHSFVPAKSGIIVTKTVDTKVPQSEWNIDKCDGGGASGYDLDLSRIQMCYIDYSWYGAGKIRFGFKTNDGLVRYVHEFKHNNVLFESYLRSGNLPARYEVVTFENPTYIPSLFHWGTSVIMDGTFDDDRGYLFTAGSQNLSIEGTTTKSFAGAGINLETDLITSLTHGFRNGDVVQFQSIAADGFPGLDELNPSIESTGEGSPTRLSNTEKYQVIVDSPDTIHLSPTTSPVATYDAIDGGIKTSKTVNLVTVVANNHGLSTGDYVRILNSSRVPNGSFFITVTDPNTFTYEAFASGSQEFVTPGTFSWTAPEGVTSVSAVAIGGGGGGGQTTSGAGGGGGGGLGWRNKIPVIPGQEYTVVVGAGGARDTDTGTGNNAQAGGQSYFISTSTVRGLGGGPAGQVGGQTVYRRGGAGGGFTGDGGGNGGNGGGHDQSDRAGGGGGAGGYTGNGGAGGGSGGGSNGSGGGGGGGGAGSSTLTGGNGGGVGLLGSGSSGIGGGLGGNGGGGGGGSGGENGGAGTSSPRNGGLFGGGGGGADNSSNTNAAGGSGAVRIIWNSENIEYPNATAGEVALEDDVNIIFGEIINFTSRGNIQYTYFLHPDGSLNNTSGPNYQPLISLRLSPSADSGLTGKLGDRDIINRMQIRMQEIGVSTDELVEVKLILNGRLNNLGFTPVDAPSLVELVEHTLQDTISGGIQVYNFQAEAGSTTTLELDSLFELSNSILGGDNIFPDGPDILTVAVSRLTGSETRTSAKLSWLEAQA